MKQLKHQFFVCSIFAMMLSLPISTFARERDLSLLIGANDEDIVHMLSLLSTKQTSNFVDESLEKFCKKMSESSGYRFLVDAHISGRTFSLFSDSKTFSELLTDIVGKTNSYVLVKDGYYLMSDVGQFIGSFDREVTKEDLVILSDMLYKTKSELKVGSRDFEIALHRNDMRNFINVLKRLDLNVELKGTNVLFPVIDGFH